jgi:hypothetical protein
MSQHRPTHRPAKPRLADPINLAEPRNALRRGVLRPDGICPQRRCFCVGREAAAVVAKPPCADGAGAGGPVHKLADCRQRALGAWNQQRTAPRAAVLSRSLRMWAMWAAEAWAARGAGRSKPSREKKRLLFSIRSGSKFQASASSLAHVVRHFIFCH